MFSCAHRTAFTALALLIAHSTSSVSGQDFKCAPEWVAKQTGYNSVSDFDCNRDTKAECLLAHCCWDESVEGVPPCTKRVAPDAPITIPTIVSHQLATTGPQYDEEDGKLKWAHAVMGDIPNLRDRDYENWVELDMSMGAYAIMVDAGTLRAKRMEGMFIHNDGNVKDVEIHTCRSSKPSSCTNNALVCRGNKRDWHSNPKCKFWHKGKNRKQEEHSQFWMVKIVADDTKKKVKVSEIEFFSDVVEQLEGEGQCLWQDKLKNRATVNIDELTDVSCPDTGCSLAACKEACALNTACYGFSYDNNANTCSFKGEAMDGIEKIGKGSGQGACEALLFEHGSFNGHKGTFLMSGKDSSHEFRYEEFHKEMINDALSSLSVSEGCGVTVYENDLGANGWSASFPAGDWNKDTFTQQMAKHDQASSMRMYHNYASPGCGTVQCQKYSKTWTFGSTVALRSTTTGKYCVNWGDRIACTQDHIGGYERFTIMDATRQDWRGQEAVDNSIGLKSNNGHKICADEGNRMLCNRDWVGGWEAFYAEHVGTDRKIKIKSHRHDKYCGIHDQHFKCNDHNNEEEFIVECVDNCITLPEESYCYSVDYKYDPIDNIDGQGRTHESGPEACATRCRNTHGCKYFSFWPDGGCHLSDATAVMKESRYVVAGPGAQCPQDTADVDEDVGIVTEALVKAKGVDTYIAECDDPKPCKNKMSSDAILKAGEYLQQGLATAYVQLDGALVLAWNGVVVMQTETVDPTVFKSIWLWECPAYNDLQLLPSCKSASVGSLCTGKDDDKTDGWGKLPWHQHIAKHWEAFGDLFDTRCANIWNLFDPWVLVYRMDHVSENYLKFDKDKGEVLIMDGAGWSQWYWDAGTKADWAGCANPGTEYDLVVADECPADKGAAEGLPECKDVTEIGALCRGDGTCGTNQCDGKCHNCNYDEPGIWDDVWDFFSAHNRFDIYKVVSKGEVGGMQIGSDGHLQIVANGQLLASTSDKDYTELITHSAIALVGFAGLGLGVAGMLAGGAVAFGTVGVVAAGIGVVTAAILPAVLMFPGLALAGMAMVGGVVATAFVGTAFAGGLVLAGGAAIAAPFAAAAFALTMPLWMYFGPMISVYAAMVAVPLVATGAVTTIAGTSLMATLLGGATIFTGTMALNTIAIGTMATSATVAGGAAVVTGAAAVSGSIIGFGTAMGGAAVAAGSAAMAGVFTTSAVLIMEKMMEENDFTPGDCGTVSRTEATLPLPDKCFYQNAEYRSGSTMKKREMSAVGLAEAMMTEEGSLAVWHNGDEVWNSGDFGADAYTEVHRDRIQIKNKDGVVKWEHVASDETKKNSGCPKIEWVTHCPSEHTLRHLGSCKLGVDTVQHNKGDYCHSYHSDECGIDWWHHTFGSHNCEYCDWSHWCHPWWTWHRGWHDVCHSHCWKHYSKVYQVVAEPEAKLFMDYDGALKFTYGTQTSWEVGGSFWTGEGCTRNEVLQNSLPKEGDYVEKAASTKLYQVVRQRGALRAFALIGMVAAIIQTAYTIRRKHRSEEKVASSEGSTMRVAYTELTEDL